MVDNRELIDASIIFLQIFDLQPPLPIAPETVRIDRENSGVTIK